MSLRGVSASVTDIGKVRKHNEDALLELPERGLWVVADGMGGHSAGEVASGMIVSELSQVDSHGSLSDFIEDAEQRLLAVNERLQRLAEERPGAHLIGSTVAVLLVFGRQAACLWAGDSRVYRFRNGELRRLTTDHSEIEELLAMGAITAEAAETHPAANVITRAIGAMGPGQTVDVRIADLREGDRFLLCSDGFYRYAEPEEIAPIMVAGDSGECCRALFELAMSRKCSDNISLVIVDFVAA